jgi:hypothetical protein
MPKAPVEEAPVVEEEPGVVPEPEPPKRGLVWQDLSEVQLQEFLAVEDPAERINTLCKFLGIKRYKSNARAAIFVDFCFLNLVYCTEQANYDNEKTSAFFSIMKQIFEEATEKDETGELVGMEASFKSFKVLILKHSVEDPEVESVGVFSVADVQKMTDFVTKSFFRHFKSYQYAFSELQETEVCVKELIVETPLAPPPLDDAEMIEGGSNQEAEKEEAEDEDEGNEAADEGGDAAEEGQAEDAAENGY